MALLDAIGAECTSNLSIGLASLLATLAPTYALLPHGICNRLPLLLWHLLALPPTHTSSSAAASLRATLVTTLRSGPPEQRQQAIAIAIRPLQRACQVPLASPRPGHRRGRGSGSGGSGGGGSFTGSIGSIGGGAYSSASDGEDDLTSPPASSRGRPTDLPPALAAAGDKLPIALALELLRSVAETEPTRADAASDGVAGTTTSGTSLVAQLEPRLNLFSLATQLVALPTHDAAQSSDPALASAVAASIAQTSCSPPPRGTEAAAAACHSAHAPTAGRGKVDGLVLVTRTRAKFSVLLLS